MADANEKMRDALVAYRYVQRKMLEKWSEGDERVKAGLWAALHKCEALADEALATAIAQSEANRSPEDAAEQFIQAEIDRAPEPLRRLGEYLTRVLDEDEWKTAERMLLGATEQPAQGEAVVRVDSIALGGRVVGTLRKGANAAEVVGALLYTAPPAPSVPDGWKLAQFEPQFETCETSCKCAVCGTVFGAAPEVKP